MARPMEHQAALLLGRLGLNEPHVCPGDCLADSLGVGSIVLLPLDVRLHVGRRHQTHRMPERLQLARPMMGRSAGLNTNEARRQPLKEWQNVPALELTASDYITCRVNSVDLKNGPGDIETDCRDRLHVWLLRIVGALTAPTSMALPCRWRSRPQHHKQTSARRCCGAARGAGRPWRRECEPCNGHNPAPLRQVERAVNQLAAPRREEARMSDMRRRGGVLLRRAGRALI